DHLNELAGECVEWLNLCLHLWVPAQIQTSRPSVQMLESGSDNPMQMYAPDLLNVDVHENAVRPNSLSFLFESEEAERYVQYYSFLIIQIAQNLNQLNDLNAIDSLIPDHVSRQYSSQMDK